MKSAFGFFVAVLASVLLFCGCADNQNTQGAAAPSNGKSILPAAEYGKLPGGAIIMRVDGTGISKSEFDRWIALKKKIMILKTPPKTQSGKEELAFVDHEMLKSLTNAFPLEVAVRNYAKENGIKPEEKALDECKKAFLSNCGIRTSWEKASNRFSPVEWNTVRQRIGAEALERTAKADWLAKNRTVLTEKDFDKIEKSFNDYNRRCAATNEQVFALASNIWSRALSGERFFELAEKYDQDETRSPDGLWGEYTIQDIFDEPELLRNSRLFKPGYTSPPIEADNGLMIIRVESVEDPAANPAAPDYIPSAEAVFTLSRIFLHLPEFIEKTDMTTLRREAQTAKDNADFVKFMKGKAAKYKIEYPSGTEIFLEKEEDDMLK